MQMHILYAYMPKNEESENGVLRWSTLEPSTLGQAYAYIFIFRLFCAYLHVGASFGKF